MIDLLQTFKEMGIDEKGLMDYVKNFDADCPSPLPVLPVPRPQAHLYNSVEQKVIRRNVVMTTRISLDEELDIQEVESEEEEVWEEIPGYLPPLPKIKNNLKGQLQRSCAIVLPLVLCIMYR